MTQIKIRAADPSDAPRLSEIKVAAWGAAYGHIFQAEFLAGLDYPQQHWDRHLDGLLVAVVDDRVTGYCSYAPADEEQWGEIRAIYVDPSMQGRGQGSALMAEAERRLAGYGYRRALLWVIDRNHSARGFYEGRGWRLGSPIRLEDIGGTQVTLVRYEINL